MFFDRFARRLGFLWSTCAPQFPHSVDLQLRVVKVKHPIVVTQDVPPFQRLSLGAQNTDRTGSTQPQRRACARRPRARGGPWIHLECRPRLPREGLRVAAAPWPTGFLRCCVHKPIRGSCSRSVRSCGSSRRRSPTKPRAARGWVVRARRFRSAPRRPCGRAGRCSPCRRARLECEGPRLRRSLLRWFVRCTRRALLRAERHGRGTRERGPFRTLVLEPRPPSPCPAGERSGRASRSSRASRMEVARGKAKRSRRARLPTPLRSGSCPRDRRRRRHTRREDALASRRAA